MTIVGKILTFIVLIFSLVIGYGEMVRYVTREKAAEVLARESENRKKAEEQNAATTLDNKTLKDKVSSLQKQLDTKEEGKSYRETALAKQNETLRKQLDEEQNKNAQRDAVIQLAKLEGERRQKDVEDIRKALAEEIANSSKLIEERTKAVQDKVKAELDARTANEGRQRLERQIDDMTRDLTKLQAMLGQGAGAPGGQANGRPAGVPVAFDRAGKTNVPPIDIEGHVLQIDDKSGLMKLSVGSDSGLQPGMTLEVFRLSKTPGASKYLGTIRVTDVGPKEAVAQPVGKLTDRLRPGDEVSSRINRN
jgi:hypothetical protein